MDIFSLIALAKANSTSSSGGGGSDHAVLYTTQSLTSNQKTQARENIGAGTYSVPSDGISLSTLNSSVQNSLGNADNAVLYNTSQSLNSNNKLTARQNIGAAAESALSNYATTASLETYISELDTKAEKMTIVNMPDDAIILYPNRVYVVDHLVDMMAFILRPLYEEYEEYSIIFTTGSSIPRISIPSEIRMPEGVVFDSNTRYEINIFDNYATVGHWELD